MADRVLMADVAQLAGVSLQTVSRVVNGSTLVTEATKTKVMDAINTLGYRPNLAARNLAASQSKAVGVLLTGDVDHGMSSAFRAVEHAAREQGYYLCVATAEDPKRYEVALEQLVGQAVAGCIVLARSADVLDALATYAPSLPTCLVFTDHNPGDNTAVVAVDQKNGIRNLIDHLTDLNRTQLCHITGDMSWDDALARREAFVDYCQEIGTDFQVVTGYGWSAQAGYDAALALLDDAGASVDKQRPDAIVAANDNLALGVIRCLHERGLRIPEDIAVTGFDDSPLSAWTTPSLTTVTQDFTAIGSAALQALMELLEGKPGPKVILTPELVVRESTAGKT
ncbi:MAG: LacI family DNA-binding transcriptional regulator [Corynebacterium sp.]|uniref:LacI family DNA-binding transcriptional regulator n=1 Tax=Corynebacterium sp. TaxID=1720 RepID=UPI0026DC57C6|nr:LacI family DNA-binding transcriptional regulator [Corynebacterium sp.]MDO4762096.1 LacI family DNA-binding transcriptional regulator [Corynebacterium sp.]